MPCRFTAPLRALLTVLITFIAAIAVAGDAGAAQKGIVPDLTWGTSDAEQTRTAKAIEDLGAQWVRLNVSWYWLDAYPEKLAGIEQSVQMAHAAGAKVLVMFNHSPAWASGSDNLDAPPRDPQDYGDALGALARHLRGQVDAYEIWNEPNHPHFWPAPGGPDPAAYAALLKAGSQAVRAADPSAAVVFGGLAFNDYNFLERAYEAAPDLGDSFDVMGVHPYPMPFNQAPEVTERAPDGRISPYSFSGYREVHATTTAHGEAKPVWFTEFGWSTTTNPTQGVSEETQADYLTRAFEFVEQDPFVEVAMTYNLRNNYFANDADTWDDRLGLMHSDFSLKPAYSAFKAYAPPVSAEPELAPEPAAAPPAAADREETAAEALPVTSEPPVEALEPTVTVSVRTVRPSQDGAPQHVTVTGRVEGASHGTVGIVLERRSSGSQAALGMMSVARVRAGGRFRSKIRTGRRGKWQVRAVYRTPRGAGAAASKPARFVVR
jgi:hypothetical protein